MQDCGDWLRYSPQKRDAALLCVAKVKLNSISAVVHQKINQSFPPQLRHALNMMRMREHINRLQFFNRIFFCK